MKYKYYCPRCGTLNYITDEEMGDVEGRLIPVYPVRNDLKDRFNSYWIKCKNCNSSHHILKHYIVEV